MDYQTPKGGFERRPKERPESEYDDIGKQLQNLLGSPQQARQGEQRHSAG